MFWSCLLLIYGYRRIQRRQLDGWLMKGHTFEAPKPVCYPQISVPMTVKKPISANDVLAQTRTGRSKKKKILFGKPLVELAPIALPRPRFYKPWPEENFDPHHGKSLMQ